MELSLDVCQTDTVNAMLVNMDVNVLADRDYSDTETGTTLKES